MAVVPTARNLVDLPSPGTNARVDAPNMGAGGEMIGRALTGLGENIDQAANDQAQIALRRQSLIDNGAVKDQNNALMSFYTSAGFDGPDGFFNKKGRDAVLARPDFEKALNAQVSAAQSALKDPVQQRVFEDSVVPQVLRWKLQIAQHASEQGANYDAESSAAAVDNAANLARNTFLIDPAHGDAQVETAKAQLEHLARLNGWSPEVLAVKTLAVTSGIYSDVAKDMLLSAGQDAPTLADAFLKKYGSQMTEDARVAVQTDARSQADYARVQQEHAAAVQQRLVTQAKTDARMRAESAAENIDLGIPMKPQDYAQAVTDARTAEDPSLLHRIQVGQFKNNLNIKYEDATPSVLQARVNDLSAQIAQAGRNAQPATVLERDHLQGLLNASTEQLRSNPLAWGASHLGLTVAPLNFNSRDSINARVQAANHVAAVTGHAAEPLMPDEATMLVPQWKQGTIDQKMSLIGNLARLGPLAGAAATQVAPNDNGLLNLVALASHSNRGVAASRVSQALTGYEAIKTKPKLIDQSQAVPDFNDFAGTAFIFLPQAKDGVFTTAKALLAAEANEHGWNAWDDVTGGDNRAWFKAVNSALGAYTKNGQQLGGLATFNGGRTILPENVSLDDFEQRIARASGPQLRAAGNGDPVYGNGTAPTATDIKKMQWVPVDDGVYRLSDGSAFLHTREGGFFELNFRKIANGPAGTSFDQQLAAHGYTRY